MIPNGCGTCVAARDAGTTRNCVGTLGVNLYVPGASERVGERSGSGGPGRFSPPMGDST